jgi:hypothetical protein
MGLPVRHYVRTVIRLPLGPDQEHRPGHDATSGVDSGSEQWHATTLRAKILLLLIIAGILVLIWLVSSVLLSFVHL